MAKQAKTLETKSRKHSRRRTRRPWSEESLNGFGHLAQLMIDPRQAAEVGVLEAQAARLGDSRLQMGQQQGLAVQIGRVQGNQHLQRAVALAKGENPAWGEVGAIPLSLGSRFKVLQRREGDVTPAEGNPVAPPLPGTSLHPTVRFGSTGPAVEELQEKLNAAGATPPLAVDGIFGPLTRAAVVAFQQQHGLDPDGIVGPLTWGKMDELGLASSVGRVERTWEEQVGGQTYGMTSRYTWRITQNEIRITVRLRFTGVKNPGLVATMFDAIRTTWNVFKAVNTDTGESLDIVFDPQSVSSEADNTVRLRPGNDRSDAENWYIGDPDLNQTACHEFGHMVGLEDEYQRTHRDYTRLTGREPDAGETENPAAPADVAEELHDALNLEDEDARVAAAKGVVNTHGLVQGDYAQQVAAAYQTAYGVGIVDDIVAKIPDAEEWDIVDPFTHSSGSIMGLGTDHDHPVEARHVREFVEAVQAFKGGTWKAEPK